MVGKQTTHALKWLLLAIALVQGGWFTFDGGRAFLLGDYLTPSSGPFAGQLGPWSRIVSAAGLDPRSTSIKSLQLGLGIVWLMGLILFAIRPGIGWWAILCCSVASLWYLPFGTLLSIIVIGLLLTPQLRNLS